MTNKDISSQSSTGGKARAAKLSPEERKAIAQKAVEARWGKENPIPKITHSGTIIIADQEIACAVLETGKRVITQQTLFTAIGKEGKPVVKSGEDSFSDFPFFAPSDNLKPFISEELLAAFTPLVFRTKKGNKAYGYDAVILPMICEVYLKARESGKLHANQWRIARSCEILIRAFAKVGIIALVDECTGYQEQRARDELQKILAEYISPLLLKWTKTFPDEFFSEVFRLHKWQYKPESTARPQCLGYFIKHYVYNQLPPGVIETLEELNPQYDHNHYRKHKHHQWLSPKTGAEHLQKQILTLITIMNVSDDKEDFEINFAKWNKKSYQQRLPLTVSTEELKTE